MAVVSVGVSHGAGAGAAAVLCWFVHRIVAGPECLGAGGVRGRTTDEEQFDSADHTRYLGVR
eukprot:SAG25_NODE_562_length_6909_cov_2.841557_3_plen_62_part_00